MPSTQRLDVWNEILRLGLVPIFYHSDLEVARRIVSACLAGGATVVEYTNRGDNAYGVFSQLAAHFASAEPTAILGVGSVVDAATAALYINSGARFVVGSVFNPDVARLCNRRKVAYIPGCATPTEISEAEGWGAEIIKIFPEAAIGGPDFVRAVRRPTPWTRMMPTGIEASEECIRAWLEAGAVAVGIGSHLVRKEWVEAGDYAAITNRTAQVLAWIQQARIKPTAEPGAV